MHSNGVTLERVVNQLRDTLSFDGDFYFRTLGAAHFFYRIHKSHILSEFVADFEDHVAWFNAGLERGRIFNGRHHRQDPVFDRDLDSQTAEASLRIHLQFFVKIRGEIGAVWIERTQHSVDSAVNQILGIDFFHIAFLDDGKNVRKGFEAFIILARHRRYIRYPVTGQKKPKCHSHK